MIVDVSKIMLFQLEDKISDEFCSNQTERVRPQHRMGTDSSVSRYNSSNIEFEHSVYLMNLFLLLAARILQ